MEWYKITTEDFSNNPKMVWIKTNSLGILNSNRILKWGKWTLSKTRKTSNIKITNFTFLDFSNSNSNLLTIWCKGNKTTNQTTKKIINNDSFKNRIEINHGNSNNNNREKILSRITFRINLMISNKSRTSKRIISLITTN